MRLPGGNRGDANPDLHASWQIGDAAHLGLSIDNVINQLAPRRFADALIRQIDNPVKPADRVRAFDAATMDLAYHAVLTRVKSRAMG